MKKDLKILLDLLFTWLAVYIGSTIGLWIANGEYSFKLDADAMYVAIITFVVLEFYKIRKRIEGESVKKHGRKTFSPDDD